MSEAHGCCGPSSHVQRKWYQKPLLLISSSLAIICLTLSFFIPSFEAFRDTFLDYFHLMVWAVVLGLFLGGVVDYYVPPEYISKHLAKNHRMTVFYSVGLGFLMSACSHGILAISMELHKKGASGPAVISFLLASPWTSLPITFLLIGFFGARAFLIIGAALFVAILTGFLFQFLDKKGMIDSNPHSIDTPEHFSIRADLKKRWKEYEFSKEQTVKDIQGIWKGMRSLADMVIWWMLLGVVMASLTAAFVPHSIFMKYFGATLLGLVMTMVVATAIEVCSEGTAPLAFEIYKNTGAFGNVFAFLMGGVVTDYTEIGLIWMHLGKRTALWMLICSLPQVLLIAFLFNQLM